jgi:hypothetical protein
MDPHDQELLERQLRVVDRNQRGDSMMALTSLTVLFAALAIGGFVYAYNAPSPGTTSLASLIDEAQQTTAPR